MTCPTISNQQLQTQNSSFLLVHRVKPNKRLQSSTVHNSYLPSLNPSEKTTKKAVPPLQENRLFWTYSPPRKLNKIHRQITTSTRYPSTQEYQEQQIIFHISFILMSTLRTNLGTPQQTGKNGHETKAHLDKILCITYVRSIRGDILKIKQIGLNNHEISETPFMHVSHVVFSLFVEFPPLFYFFRGIVNNDHSSPHYFSSFPIRHINQRKSCMVTG
jgi:hypothetical protein